MLRNRSDFALSRERGQIYARVSRARTRAPASVIYVFIHARLPRCARVRVRDRPVRERCRSDRSALYIHTLAWRIAEAQRVPIERINSVARDNVNTPWTWMTMDCMNRDRSRFAEPTLDSSSAIVSRVRNGTPPERGWAFSVPKFDNRTRA